MTARSPDIQGDPADVAELRVWWIPQVPMKAFEFPVPTIEAGAMLCEALAQYDLFQFENRIKPDYCNTGGISFRHSTLTDGEWHDFEPRDEWEMDELRELVAQAIEAGTAETEGLGAKHESAARSDAPKSNGDA